MTWQKFDLFEESFTPKISIRATGHIGFSAGAVNKFKLKDYKHCELYYDDEEKLIGFRLTNDFIKGSTTKVVVRDIDCFISAKRFLDYYGIDYSPTKSYYGKCEEGSSLIVIDLKQPVLIHGKRGKKKAEKSGGDSMIE